MKKEITLPRLDMIIYVILLIVVVTFMSHILTRVYYFNEFRHEFVIRVQPKGVSHFLHPPYYRNTTLPYENHKVIIKNGVIVKVERIGYSFQ